MTFAKSGVINKPLLHCIIKVHIKRILTRQEYIINEQFHEIHDFILWHLQIYSNAVLYCTD